MSLKADVTKRGAVLLGRYVACDGFDESRPLRVVTHAHSDHLLSLRQSLKQCEFVVMTPPTKDLIEVLEGPTIFRKDNVMTLKYEEPFLCDNELLTLCYADHILGAAQVLVEDVEGTRILYTSDFRLPRTPTIETDILVMEATYGNPYRIRSFQEIVEDTLISLVEKGLKQGPVYMFSYYGKLQEVMQILHMANVDAPFIVPEKIFRLSKICEKYGMIVGELPPLSGDEQAQSMLSQHEPCVAFYHMSSRQHIEKDAFRIYVSGWEFRSPCRQINQNEYTVALSGHSDFNGLLQYVSECEPRMVITDNHRVGDAFALAKEIQRRLGIPAMPLPSERNL